MVAALPGGHAKWVRTPRGAATVSREHAPTGPLCARCMGRRGCCGNLQARILTSGRPFRFSTKRGA
jgi:hypothetical protein